MTGLVVFGASSVMCAMFQSLSMLVVFRFVQGMGAAMLGSIALVVIVRMLPEGMRVRGFSIASIAVGLSIMVGPLLGGVIVSVASWHWMFLVNVPVCVLLFLLGRGRMVRVGNPGAILDDKESASFMLYLGLNHLFCISTGPGQGTVDEYYNEMTVNPTVINDMAEFMLSE